MFTGIIEEVGTILDMKKAGSAMSLVIQSNKVIEDVKARRQHCCQRSLPDRK